MPTFEYKADAATPCLTLIPAPVTLEYTHGTAMIESLVTIEKRIPEYAVTEDADETWETLPIEQLSSELERYCGVAVRTRRVLTATDEADAGANAAEKARDAGVGAGAGAGAPAAMNGTVILLCVDARLAHDEYTLDVFASDTIAVRGGSESGLRYGMQTLRQMIRQTSRTLPCLHIQDKPAFAVRAYSLDVTRGRVPTMAFLTWFIDQLALYKYNQFQLYVEHAFAFGELSEAWRGTDPLTADDIMFLDEYCAHHGIELVPSLATFGHMYMNLRTREHRGLGEFPEDADRPFSFIERMEHHTLNAANPKSHDFASRLIEEYAPLFRSRSFNIGGDETFDLGRGRSVQDSPGASRDELYADFVKDLCSTLAHRGLQPMLWADIALENPHTMDLLPGDITMLNWMYEPDIDESKIQTIASQGRRQFVCPAVRAWSRFFPDYDGAWLNTYRMAVAGLKYGAEGMVVTDWGDYGHVNDPRLSVPGLCYGAQNAWNPVAIDACEMNHRISNLAYGDESGWLMDSLARIDSDGVSFPWDLAVQVLELEYGSGTGMLNTDVASYVERSCGGELMFDRALGCADARRRLLLRNHARLERRRDCDRALIDCGSAVVAVLDGSARGGLNPELLWVMLDGQRLFNRLGEELLVLAGGEDACDTKDVTGRALDASRRARLAADLELWFERYRVQWLSIGRYAELARIAHVVWSFADILRRGAL
ncbi:N-acetyl-beta-hexosaminidase [Bifidobacterium longum]|uniref:beta-N-acetylhexosaminidase n=1 Tax=Bifidobacterium longum TaxID=216816 RepID=UPI000E4E041D|nr:family 20 glycosylhydrolase [Bifidobacterium longum]RHJ19021.1 N-acetyl-beta-hexosaminidase [Bifidobacterium longum]